MPMTLFHTLAPLLTLATLMTGAVVGLVVWE